jgi:hypothetical protein
VRALYLEGSEARLVDMAEPTPSAQMARIRISLAGVCNTDLELVKGSSTRGPTPGADGAWWARSISRAAAARRARGDCSDTARRGA